MIVPGGGILLDGERWVSSRPAFLLPVRVPAKLSGGCSCLEPEEPGRLALHPAGKPQQKAFAESLIGRLRDECLNETVHLAATSSRRAAAWQHDHNSHAASLRAGHAWPCLRTSVSAAGCWAVKLAAWASGLLLELKGDPPCSKADHEFERGGQLGPGGNRGHCSARNFSPGSSGGRSTTGLAAKSSSRSALIQRVLAIEHWRPISCLSISLTVVKTLATPLLGVKICDIPPPARSGVGIAELAIPCRHGGRRSRPTRAGRQYGGSVAIHPREPAR
jgi:hypothetical protein